MEPDLVAIARELLKRKRAILIEALRGKRNPSSPPSLWLQGMSIQQRKQMLKAITAALARVEEDDYGYCRSCFMKMPWAEIARSPERENCGACSLRIAATRRPRSKARRRATVRS